MKFRFQFLSVTMQSYNQENVLPSIDFYDVGDPWNESTPTFTQKTANLKIMGGDADVDNFLKATRSNVQDLEAAIVELKAKALKDKFEDTFIYGNSASNTKQYDGIRKLIDTTTASAQVIAMGATGATLTLDKMDELIDAVKGGKPDMLLMSRRTRRKINALIRALRGFHRYRPGHLRKLRPALGRHPGRRERLDTRHSHPGKQRRDGDHRRHLFDHLRFPDGRRRSLRAYRSGSYYRRADRSIESKDASRTRIKWYVSLALFSSIKAAALIGVQD